MKQFKVSDNSKDFLEMTIHDDEAVSIKWEDLPNGIIMTADEFELLIKTYQDSIASDALKRSLSHSNPTPTLTTY